MNDVFADSTFYRRLTRIFSRRIAKGRKVVYTVFSSFGMLAGILTFQTSTVTASGYVTVTFSTSAPQNIEQVFIAGTTEQFDTTLIANPLAFGVYRMIVNGPNPSFNAPVTATQLLNSLTAATTTNYVPGFADGMTYQQTMEEGLIGGAYGVNCSSPSAFNLTQTSTATFDSGTCSDVIATIENALFQQSLSTPTVIPPEP